MLTPTATALAERAGVAGGGALRRAAPRAPGRLRPPVLRAAAALLVRVPQLRAACQPLAAAARHRAAVRREGAPPSSRPGAPSAAASAAPARVAPVPPSYPRSPCPRTRSRSTSWCWGRSSSPPSLPGTWRSPADWRTTRPSGAATRCARCRRAGSSGSRPPPSTSRAGPTIPLPASLPLPAARLLRAASMRAFRRLGSAPRNPGPKPPQLCAAPLPSALHVHLRHRVEHHPVGSLCRRGAARRRRREASWWWGSLGSRQ